MADQGASPLVHRPINRGEHLFLVDGSSYIFRAYHALPPLTRKSDGLPVGAVAGFCNMLWRLVRESVADEKPTHIAVVFDKSAITFRNALYDGYKAQRAEPPDDLKPQFNLRSPSLAITMRAGQRKARQWHRPRLIASACSRKAHLTLSQI
jgi:DNA polymerase I